MISDNDDSSIRIGDVSLTSVAGEVVLVISDNDADTGPEEGLILVGDITLNAASDAVMSVYNSDGEDVYIQLGDISITSGEDITLDLVDVHGAVNVDLTATSAWISDSSSEVNVSVSDAWDMSSFTLSATSSDVDAYLDFVDVDSLSEIDLSGSVAGTFTKLYLSSADIDTSDDELEILVGEGDLTLLLDGDGDDTSEIIKFVGTDIGDIIIGSGRVNPSDSADGVSDGSDEIFNMFDVDGSDSATDILDFSGLTSVGGSVPAIMTVIDYFDDVDDELDSIRIDFGGGSGLTGSIIVIGVTDTSALANAMILTSAPEPV
jgi:hypothetical protein